MAATKPVPDVDPSVRIPDAVRAAGARADELYRQSMGQTEPAAEPAPEPEAKPAEPAPQAEAKPSEPAPQAQQPRPTAMVTDEASWEHRYNSMKGRYERSQQQLQAMSDQINNLQNIIATMEARVGTAQQPPPELRAERLITPEEEKDYGSEFLNVVGKKAKEELLPIVSQYEHKIAELEAKLQGVGGYVQQNARQAMMSRMDAELPSWRDVNLSDDFKSWLALPDTYSGVIRHDMLRAAFERNDTPRVLAFFKGFLAEEAAVAPATREEPEERKAQIPLESLAAPGRAKTAAASAPVEKPIFTRAQIAKFYADVGAGKYRGRDKEKDKLEAQIFEAQAEGRIR